MAVNLPQSTPQETHASLGDALDQFEPFHNQILVAIYIAPAITPGGIHKPDSLVDEDRWQGKVGLVLKKGSMAFQNDGRNDFKGQNVEPGEWIMYRVSDGFAVDIGGVHCRLIEDIHVKGRVTSPEIIY